ncbi:MAG: arginine--tRNA ligase [Sulfolobales archaeon]|nr:arginine--tRNA ligase [Sulfolobales archaeon]MDW7969882.1 arginine--tRNA ligase [Sulfolobales archaeon]
MGFDDLYTYVVNSFAKSVYDLISGSCSKVSFDDVVSYVEEPSRREYGDLALPLHRLSKVCGIGFNEFLRLVSGLRLNDLFSRSEVVGGYLNAFFDEVNYARALSDLIKSRGERYGFVDDARKLKVIIEFVSANPVHPLHIGSGRNAVLGDFLSRVFEVRGHRVQRRYYVNDLGRQVAVLVYGYIKLGRPEVPNGLKPDEWFGFLYAVTNTIVDIVRLRGELSSLGIGDDAYLTKQSELDELMGVLSELRLKDESLVNRLLEEISADEDPEGSIEELMRMYEEGRPEVKEVFRYVAGKVLSGINSTLSRLGISFDKLDWESDLVFSGMVKEVLEIAKRSDFFTSHKGAPALDFSKIQRDQSVKSLLKLPKSIEIPPLILMRSDGTTLYVTKDIAYSLMKFRDFNADLVINVVGNEQTLAQAQLRLALYTLGFKDEASKLLHYSYELVTLPGIKMSGRRGRYVSVDQVLDGLEVRVEEIMKSRGIVVEDRVKKAIAVGAFKYMMLSSSSTKVINFDPDAALNLNRNSAPYLQYTYARASSVLRKYGRDIEWDLIDFTSARNPVRREILHLVSKFPYIVRKVYEDLDPELLTTYLNRLADVFNSWYDVEPIIHEVDEGVKQFKLFLTYSVGVVIKNGLYVMGIDVLERI